jgi:hypothetical protein
VNGKRASLVIGHIEGHNLVMWLSRVNRHRMLAALLLTLALAACTPTAPSYSPYPPQDNNSAHGGGDGGGSGM